MTPRERTLAAIRHEIPDRIPVDAICIENGDAIAENLGISPESVLERLGIDGRIVCAPYTGEFPTSANGDPLSEWGTSWRPDYAVDRGFYPLADARSLAEIEAYAWPDVGLCDFEAAAESARAMSRYAVRGPYWMPLFCRACDMFGMEEAMVRMSLEPALFEAVIERVADYIAEYCRRLIAACGDAMPILCLGDDFATQRGLMISPDQWRRFLKPHFARIFEVAKRAGKHVWFHSCGDVTSVLPDLIEIGVDVWETVQLHTLPMSPSELKREYGRDLCFFGAVNTQRLPFITPDEVREETMRCIEVLGADGGYICGPDHHVKPDVSAANTIMLFDTATSFRKDGYTCCG